jgi:hypothetical protein
MVEINRLQIPSKRWLPRRSLNNLTLIATIILLTAASCFAAEIRIVDSDGLNRATRDIKGETASVQISIDGATGGEKVMLSNVDGVATDRSSTAAQGNVFVIPNVPAGNWKIVVAPNRAVLQVKIQPQ